MAARGLTNYWGYNSIGFFAPHNAYSSVGRPRPAGHRVQADGEGLPRRRARGDPRRGLQPHRRGRRRRPDAVASAGSTTAASTSGSCRPRQPGDAGPTTPTGTSPAAATPSTPSNPFALRLILDSLRYWVTEMHVDGFRFDLLSALTRTGHDVDMRCAPADRDRPGPGAAAREADRRAVGRLDGRLPGRRVPAAVGGVERPVPRHDPRLLARPLRAASAPSRPGWPARRTCTPTTAARRTPRSTSSPPTTASRCATWCPTTHKHNEANGEDNRDGTDNNRSLEPRRRGRDRRPGRSSRCAAGRRPT